jgi:glycosyltransferase involved in cell wall biosynthesis
LRIVIAHNFYQQAGGEDQVFADETALLESRGHTVTRHTVHNDEVNNLGRITLAGRTIWNRQSHRELADLVRRERAEVVHFHNTFPLLSPSVYSAARSAGAAVVQTLHNYRLICPTAICYRDGHVCEDCVTRTIPWPAIVHRCYRSDRSASVVTSAMLAVHHMRGTYAKDVDAYIALTEFAKSKFVQAGLPEQKFIVKPNFVSPDPGIGDGSGGFCAFVGRLTESKGISVLLKAWKQLRGDIHLKIAGDGEMASTVRDAAATDSRIHFVGRLPSDQIYALLGQAAALVFPSVWYEGLPKTILESYAKGTPVIASNLGSMSDLISDGRTGARFTPGNPADLARTITRLFAGNELATMRKSVREEFDAFYTGDANYRMLMDVYAKILSGGVLAGVVGSGPP